MQDAGINPMITYGSYFKQETAYKKAMSDWEAYQHWQEHRNPQRKELEALFGMDTKFAMHLVRLLRQGYEILTEGKVLVRRPDAAELLAIRKEGIWSYEDLVSYAETMEAKLESVVSCLPKSPDIRFLDNLCVSIVQDYNKT